MGLNIGDIYAKAGERVTCENGHDVCEFTKEVMVGDRVESPMPLNFVDGQSEPIIGTPLRDCKCYCGAYYMHWDKNGIFHFADGWRQ